MAAKSGASAPTWIRIQFDLTNDEKNRHLHDELIKMFDEQGIDYVTWIVDAMGEEVDEDAEKAAIYAA